MDKNELKTRYSFAFGLQELANLPDKRTNANQMRYMDLTHPFIFIYKKRAPVTQEAATQTPSPQRKDEAVNSESIQSPDANVTVTT